MKKIWYLSTCDTCTKIIKELDLENKNFIFINIKENPISEADLELIQRCLRVPYEDLFNKRAQKYTKTNLKAKLKSEEDWKLAILKEYTFMKRPIIQIDSDFFVGNSKLVIEKVKERLN